MRVKDFSYDIYHARFLETFDEDPPAYARREPMTCVGKARTRVDALRRLALLTETVAEELGPGVLVVFDAAGHRVATAECTVSKGVQMAVVA